MRLPIEVLEAVIDQASDNSSTLHHLSLTCATLLPRSRLHLFRGIVIQTNEQLWSFREFLDSRSWLVSIVQQVTLQFEPEGGPKLNSGLLDAAPVHLLTRLPNLHVWQMGPATQLWLSLHRSTLLCYRKYGDRIRCLQLYNIDFDHISDFRGLVSAFTGIDSLECYSIGFKSIEHEHADNSPVTVGMSIQPLPISTLRITTCVNSQAIEYLLACSGSKLKNLTLELWATDGWLDDRFELLEQSMMWLTGLSSLVLVLFPGRHHIPSNAENFSRILISATKILQQVRGCCLKDVRVGFVLKSIPDLGAHLSGSTAPCTKELEAALLTFPNTPILIGDSEDAMYPPNAGKAELWSPIICSAFPKLNDQGRLTLEFTSSNEDAPGPAGHKREVASIVISQDSTQVVTASWDGIIIIWDMASGTVLREWVAHEHSLFAVLTLSPDGLRLVSAGGNTLAVWSIKSSSSPLKVAKLEGHTDMVTACAWSPDGGLIASGSWDGTVHIWDGHTYQQRGLLGPPASPHSKVARSLKFSPDGRYLAWISGRKSCCVWTPLAGEPPKMLPSHPDRQDVRIKAFAFDHESRYIATAHGTSNKDLVFANYMLNIDDSRCLDACVVRTWDAATGAPLAVLTGHSRAVSNVSFSSDGRSLLSVSKDMSVRVWDCETWSGEQMGVFGARDGKYLSPRSCFRHDGKFMATVSVGEQVKLWRTRDGSCVATFDEHDRVATVARIVFSPNGQFLVSGDCDGIVRIHCISKYVDE